MLMLACTKHRPIKCHKDSIVLTVLSHPLYISYVIQPTRQEQIATNVDKKQFHE